MRYYSMTPCSHLAAMARSLVSSAFAIGLLGVIQVGCQSSPDIHDQGPIDVAEYLAHASLPVAEVDEPVRVAPVGLRVQPDPWGRWDGTWWILVDLAIDGPPDRARSLAGALKYQFHGRAPSLITIRDATNGQLVSFDETRYDTNASSFVHFDAAVFHEQPASSGRILVLQPYPLAVRRAPRGAFYEVSLNTADIRARLMGVNSHFVDVDIDGSAHVFEIVKADLHRTTSEQDRNEKALVPGPAAPVATIMRSN